MIYSDIMWKVIQVLFVITSSQVDHEKFMKEQSDFEQSVLAKKLKVKVTMIYPNIKWKVIQVLFVITGSQVHHETYSICILCYLYVMTIW